jgi:hypothetical protein
MTDTMQSAAIILIGLAGIINSITIVMHTKRRH